MKKYLKIGRNISILILGILLVFMAILFAFIAFKSQGTIEPFGDKEGKVLENSISEKVWIDVDGVQIGMIIRGENKDNPVLLISHGGPGMPEYFLKDKYPIDIENYFTVCWMEQRGGGLSYNKSLTVEDITIDKLIEDNIAVTDYLLERFNQEKIYLLGHSWGTFLGIKTVSEYSEKYYAYIAVAQIANQSLSEEIAFNYMIDEYKNVGNNNMINKMNSNYSDSLRDSAMHDLGIGTTHDMSSVVSDIFFQSFLCEAYTINEKLNLWKGKSFLGTCKLNWNEDLTQTITSLDVPIYFVSGVYDYTVNYQLSRDYFDIIESPTKGFYLFQNSAHSPHFEEPELFIDKVIMDVLNGTNDNADK